MPDPGAASVKGARVQDSNRPEPNDFCSLWAPFEIVKGGADKSPATLARIRGLASTEHKDDDKETIIQSGIDWDLFVNKGGFLTVEHPAGVFNIVGEPVSIGLTELDGVPATEVVADLYRTTDAGEKIISTSMAIQKAGGRNRLGMSAEGKATKRDPVDRSIIRESKMWSLAITSQPRNRNCRFTPDPIMASILGAQLTKAHAADHAAGAAPVVALPTVCHECAKRPGLHRLAATLTDEDLATVHVLRKAAKDLTWTEAKSALEGSLKR